MSTMISSGNGQNGWRTESLYTIMEAARLARVSSVTVRHWLFGYQTPSRQIPPIFGEQDKGPLVSFLQLVEIVIASRFRRGPVKLDRIRKAYEFAKKEWDLEYPFAALKLEPLGGHVLRRFEEQEPGASLLVLDEPGQWTLPGLVIKQIHNFDYELELAARWYPLGKTIPIVIDPRFSAGMPTIPNRRVTIQAIHNRFKAGYPMRFISSDLKLKPNIVEEALRYANQIAV